MSLSLDRSNPRLDCNTGSRSDGTGFFDNEIRVGTHYIHEEDFCELVRYFFTNTDLKDNDPRTRLMHDILDLQITTGYNPGNTRLAFAQIENALFEVDQEES